MSLRNLNARERTLALVLAGTAFLLLNLFVLPRLVAANRTAKQKTAELQAQLAAAEGWMDKKAHWEEREKWLNATEPSGNAERQDSATQLEDLQASARNLGLKIDEVQLLQLEETEYYHPVGAKLTVSGPWAGLVKFVARLQDPALFDVIPRFSIKSGDQPPNVICEMEIQRWFHTTPENTP